MVSKSRSRTLKLVLIAVFVALFTVGAYVKIPVSAISISLQFLFVTLSFLLLGARLSFVAVLIYLTMGLAGLPVFVSGGGYAYVFNLSFGYLVGFLIATLVGGSLAKKKGAFGWYLVSSLIAMVIVHACGVAYMLLLKDYLYAGGNNLTLNYVLIYATLPCLPTDVIWCALASFIAIKLRPIIAKYNV